MSSPLSTSDCADRSSLRPDSQHGTTLTKIFSPRSEPFVQTKQSCRMHRRFIFGHPSRGKTKDLKPLRSPVTMTRGRHTTHPVYIAPITFVSNASHLWKAPGF